MVWPRPPQPLLLVAALSLSAGVGPPGRAAGARPQEATLLRREELGAPSASSLSPDSEPHDEQGRLTAVQEHVTVQVRGHDMPILLDRARSADAGAGAEDADEHQPGAPVANGFRVGEMVTWIGADEMIPPGSVGRVVEVLPQNGKVQVEFPRGRYAFQPQYLRRFTGAPIASGFRAGELVTWIGADEMIPPGSVGRVLKVFPENGKVLVDFPRGRYAFQPQYLRRFAGAQAQAGQPPPWQPQQRPLPQQQRWPPQQQQQWPQQQPGQQMPQSRQAAYPPGYSRPADSRPVAPRPGGSSYSHVSPDMPPPGQGTAAYRNGVGNGTHAGNQTPVGLDVGEGEAVPMPNLGSFDEVLPEDSEARNKSKKRCSTMLGLTFAVAGLAAVFGYFYLVRVLPYPNQEPEAASEEAEGADAASSSALRESAGPDAGAPAGDARASAADAASASGGVAAAGAAGAAAGGGAGAEDAAAGGAVATAPSEASDQPLLKGGHEGEGEEEKKEGAKLPDRVRYSYCLPTVATLPVSAVIAVFVLSFYSQRGASLPTMATSMAVARSFDVVSDPVMSYITDSCRHPAGRRRPFMIVGAPLYAIFLVALFTPPFLTPSMLAVWFGVAYIVFFLTNTLSNIPYDAWGPELTEDSDERARLFFLSGLFDGGGTLLAFAMPFAGFAMAQRGGLTSDMCVPKEEMVERCASGYHCGDFNANGKGYEFVENTTFTHSILRQCVNELLTYDCDSVEPQLSGGCAAEDTAIATFCQCMDTCGLSCASANRAFAFMMTGGFFALWYILTAYNCCHQVSERKPPPGGLPPSRPLVPSMLGTLQNPAFVTLLPAWACDAVSSAIFLALCPYLIMYVVAPEYQTEEDSPFGIDCKEGVRGVSTSNHYSKYCNTQNVLGACVGAALMAAIITTPLWLAAVKRYGKVKLWLLWSLVMAATNYAFLILSKSSMLTAVFVCCINGIPIAAKFLADAILADIIDYDEFLTGSRNEATYTMFKSFLPKVMAIPASALPLSIMNGMGHIPAENGRIMYQPAAVRLSIKFMAGFASGTIAMIAWYIKTRYPLKNDEILQEMAQGIALHKEGKPAKDPLSDYEYTIVTFTQEENIAGVWSLDHFPGVKLIENLRDDTAATLEALASRTRNHLIGAVGLLVSIMIGLFFSLRLMKNRMLSFVPTIMAVFMGVGFVLVGFTYCRRKAATALLASPPPPELVEKVLQQRQALQALYDAQKAKRLTEGKQQEPDPRLTAAPSAAAEPESGHAVNGHAAADDEAVGRASAADDTRQ